MSAEEEQIIKKSLPQSLQEHFLDAKAFYGIKQRILLLHNPQLGPAPAKWAVAKTTTDSFTIEYGTQLIRYPKWALRHIAFHETCHIKQALGGLACFCWKSADETGKEEIPNLKLYELDKESVRMTLGIESKDSENLLQTAVIAATDFLVNSELIDSSPVRSETISFGIVTIRGDYSCLKNRSRPLDGIAESGIWNAVATKSGHVISTSLLGSLINGVLKVRNAATSNYGLSEKSYQDYLTAILAVKVTDKGQDFFFMVMGIAKTLLQIAKDTNA